MPRLNAVPGFVTYYGLNSGAGSGFNSHRMMRRYVTKAYLPLTSMHTPVNANTLPAQAEPDRFGGSLSNCDTPNPCIQCLRRTE